MNEKRIKGCYDSLIRELRINIETRNKFFENSNSDYKDSEYGTEYSEQTKLLESNLEELIRQNEELNSIL